MQNCTVQKHWDPVGCISLMIAVVFAAAVSIAVLVSHYKKTSFETCKQCAADRNSALTQAVEWSARKTGAAVTCTTPYADLDGRTVCIISSVYKHWDYLVACNKKGCEPLRKERPLGWSCKRRYCDYDICEVVQRTPSSSEPRKQGDEK